MKVIYNVDNEYPNQLRQIKKPPKRLYALGNISLLKSNCITVVGSRKCSDYGINITKQFCKILCQNDITIVSGLALGIDTISHETAIDISGKTIAVLGGGFNNLYPIENVDLFNKILEKEGLIITEYEPDEEAKSENFPNRNRILVGLSIGILVSESRSRGGATLTANIALREGRKVFCIPYNLESKYKGTNELIKKGATLVSTADEIITECGLEIREKTAGIKYETNENIKISKIIPEEYRKIYNILSDNPKHINEICRKSKINISIIGGILTMMELDGFVQEKQGKMYIRK